jgi:hypothetical protein
LLPVSAVVLTVDFGERRPAQPVRWQSQAVQQRQQEVC